MLVCFFIQFLTKVPRAIFKIVAKIKEAMVAFVYHLNFKNNQTM
jgi:predicted SnoaL-like aldol condensation-catalyzing enzyme